MVAPAAGAVVLVRFPFSDLSQTKLRPAVVLAELVVATASSVRSRASRTVTPVRSSSTTPPLPPAPCASSAMLARETLHRESEPDHIAGWQPEARYAPEYRSGGGQDRQCGEAAVSGSAEPAVPGDGQKRAAPERHSVRQTAQAKVDESQTSEFLSFRSERPERTSTFFRCHTQFNLRHLEDEQSNRLTSRLNTGNAPSLATKKGQDEAQPT